jgi:hypothetical protein
VVAELRLTSNSTAKGGISRRTWALGALRPRTHWRDTVKSLIAMLNAARQPMTSEETKGICLVLLRPLVEEQQLALKAVFDDEDYRTAARHFARMHLHAMRASLTRDNLRMTLRLLVGTGEEREGTMSDMNTRTFRSDSDTVSLNLELDNLESALRGTSLLAELLASNGLPDEEARRQAPHCIVAQLSLVNARLRQVGRVIRGEEDAEALLAPHNTTCPSPLPGEDGDVRLVSRASPCRVSTHGKEGGEETRGS